jgi:hypothetical protein
MNSLCINATLPTNFRFWACTSPAMRLAYQFAFEGRGAALLLCAFGLGLAALA